MRHRVLLTAAFLALTAGCDLGLDSPPATRPTRAVPLHGGGSSFVAPLMQRWCEAYKPLTDSSVYYQSCGSGAGIQHMKLQTFDYGATDGPMSDEELKKARELGGEVLHIPLCMGAVVAAYNLPDVEQPLRLTPRALADLFLGKIKKWNDPALKEINPNVVLPDLDVVIVHRSDSSGTTYVWTDYLSKVSPDWVKQVGPAALVVKWPCGVAEKGNEGVSKKVAETKGALCYTELAFAMKEKLKTGILQNRDGFFIRPSLESVTAAAAASLKDLPADLRYSLTNAPGKESYPIAGTAWAVVYTRQRGDKGRALVDFLTWVTHDGQKFCDSLHYSRLPPGLIQRIDQKLKQITTGS